MSVKIRVSKNRYWDEKRFWEKVVYVDDCWIWAGCFSSDGQPLISIRSKVRRARRISLMIHDIDPELMIGCKLSRACVRPDHLICALPLSRFDRR